MSEDLLRSLSSLEEERVEEAVGGDSLTPAEVARLRERIFGALDPGGPRTTFTRWRVPRWTLAVGLTAAAAGVLAVLLVPEPPFLPPYQLETARVSTRPRVRSTAAKEPGVELIARPQTAVEGELGVTVYALDGRAWEPIDTEIELTTAGTAIVFLSDELLATYARPEIELLIVLSRQGETPAPAEAARAATEGRLDNGTWTAMLARVVIAPPVKETPP